MSHGGDNELGSSPKQHLSGGGGGGGAGGRGGGGGAALNLVDVTLRISAIPLSMVSIWLTVTNHQNNQIYGKLDFTNLLGLKYMVLISALCAAYALASAVFSWFRVLAVRAWVFFVSDQIVAYLMVTSGAAVMEIVYLAYKGDREVTWSEACSSYGHFCSRTKAALLLHFLALFCFLLLSLISAYRAFSIFPPPSSSKHDHISADSHH